MGVGGKRPFRGTGNVCTGAWTGKCAQPQNLP